MSNTITPMPTRHHAAAEAARLSAVAVACDTAALAAAELVRQLRAGLFGHIEASRQGVTRDELAEAFPAGELTSLCLAAMVADGHIEQHGACYRLPRGAA